MNLIARIMAALGWPAPAVLPPHRRVRGVCPVCGKELAIVASTARLWKHACTKPEQDAA
jgi:hypothetical protein